MWCIILIVLYTFWQNIFLTEETGVRNSTDGFLRAFGTRFPEKLEYFFRSDKRPLIFCGGIQSAGQRKTVRCPNMPYAVNCLEIFNGYEERKPFPFGIR